jgi:UbiD family decarboxylase
MVGMVSQLAHDLRSFLVDVEKCAELKRISQKVSPRFQISRVMKENDGGDVLLFENVDGYTTHLVSGLCGSKKRLAQALGKRDAQLYSIINQAISSPNEPKVTEGGPVSEVAEPAKFTRIPILTHYENEPGPYITAGIVSVRDNENHIENVSIHRMLVLDDSHLTIRIVPRHLYALSQMAKNKGKQSLDIAVAIGLHPAIMIATSSPAPFGVSEYAVANALMDGSLVLTEIGSSGLRVPADAELAFEAKLFLNRDVNEGPFVDLTGTYDIVRKQPLIEVTRVYHRTDYIYQALLSSGAEHRLLMGLPYEARIFQAVRGTVPKVNAVNLTSGGCGWLHAAIAVDKQTEGDGKNAMMAAFGAHPSLKHVIVVDADIDVTNPQEVEWAIATRLQADKGLVIIPNARGSTLDPSADQGNGTTTKVGVDATRTLQKPAEKFMRAKIPE